MWYKEDIKFYSKKAASLPLKSADIAAEYSRHVEPTEKYDLKFKTFIQNSTIFQQKNRLRSLWLYPPKCPPFIAS